MDDDVPRSAGGGPEGRRSAAKRALRGAASPFVGYFDRRFQDVHEHVDRQPRLDQLAADLRRELSQTRADVAADTDTIAELAFTLERFADLFTMRMEELAGEFAAGARAPDGELASTVVELPFAFASAAELEQGAAAVTIGDAGRLSIGLTALGLDVTALEPAARITHPDVDILTERVDEWGGPGAPLDAIFALTPALDASAAPTRPVRERLDLFRKWLRPAGLLVLGIRAGGGQGMEVADVEETLADWDIARREWFAQDAGGAWRRSGDESRAGVLLVQATPRA
jgi:hypothetical protein